MGINLNPLLPGVATGSARGRPPPGNCVLSRLIVHAEASTGLEQGRQVLCYAVAGSVDMAGQSEHPAHADVVQLKKTSP
jgi:hypothetical protein